MSAKAAAKLRPLRVVHLIEALGPGGAERLLYTNLKHFDPARVRSTVITLYSTATHWREPIRELGVEVHALGCAGPRDFPRGVVRLRALGRGVHQPLDAPPRPLRHEERLGRRRQPVAKFSEWSAHR